MMANIDKQEIARLPLKQESNLTFVFDEDSWYIPVKKIWHRKEMTRVYFRIIEGENTNWFECSTALANKIQSAVDEALGADDIDLSKVDLLDISISRKTAEDPQVLIDTEKLPRLSKMSKWNKVWLSVKNVFRRKK